MESRYDYLKEKRIEVLEYLKPICEAFKIKDYDYEIDRDTGAEFLRIYNTKIGCSSNSITAIRDELVGYIFIVTFCKNRGLGTFKTQTLNFIRQYWL